MLALLLLVACTAPVKESQPEDADGDGVVAGEDCDDEDAIIYPGASEICDDKDNNCDGAVDEGVLSNWYLDRDGDGYGDPEKSLSSCTPPDDYVLEAGDCDDSSRKVHPGVEEVCDNLDNDCDGTVDSGAVDAVDWYPDVDMDGYGDDTGLQNSCFPPEGSVSAGGDCNDLDSRTHPGAEESCDEDVDRNCDGSSAYSDLDGDGFGACQECDDSNPAINPDALEFCNELDDNCDGSIDNNAEDGTLWYPDSDGDGYGDASSPARACSRPSGYLLDASDCEDGDASIFPGAPEFCNSLDDDCDGSVDEAALDMHSWYRDQDGDGFGDAASVQNACDAPVGYVSDNTDCDPARSNIYPGATESCDAFDNDCDGLTDEPDAVDASVWYFDSDQDGYGGSSTTTACSQPVGYVGSGTDCNDAESNVFPGAPEVCDGVDQDCDGSVDEGASGGSLWYRDADGDGYGTTSVSQTACSQPAGYVLDGTDCNDGESSVNPSEVEVCDGVDNDCDGATDESSATDALVWYRDADGDGYGSTSSSTLSCTQPAGYAGTSTDCDDGNSSINPGAQEVCDSSDQDCDGLVDEGAVDAFDWYEDADGDGYGDASSPSRACTQPAGYIGNDVDCDDNNTQVNPSEVEICNGLDDDCDGATDDASSVDADTWYQDADGDGFGTVATSTVSCVQPAGYVLDASDCYDSSNTIYPGASESCDGVDEDCDGVADNDPIDGTSYYPDSDGDGFGDSLGGMVSCSQPSGWLVDGSDCDDSDETVNPLAVEVCDGVDEDCNGTVDDTPPQYEDSDGDGFGDPNSVIYDCGLQSGYVYEDATDCDDSSSTIHPYAYELMADGIDNDCDGGIDSADPSTLYYVNIADDSYVTVTFGSSFSFPLCGVSYSSAYMISNGRVTFGSADTDNSESSSELAADKTVAPLWDDFNPASGSPTLAVVGHTDAIGFYWRNVREYLATTTSTFSVVIFEDGRMLMEYGNVAATDGLVGWSCAPGGSLTEIDVTSSYNNRALGAWGIGQGLESYSYELFGTDNDLDNRILRFCGGSGVDEDGDGWSDACGDLDDLDPSVYPGNQ